MAIGRTPKRTMPSSSRSVDRSVLGVVTSIVIITLGLLEVGHMGCVAMTSRFRGLAFAAATMLSAETNGLLLHVPAVSARREPVLQSVFDSAGTEEVVSAIAGGTVGVLGSVLAIEVKKMKVQKSKECPYCNGKGSLVCAGCLGESSDCIVCSGVRVIPCENCKGRGRFIPTMLDRRASRDPETAAEDIGLL